jgi:hypothetical protein
MTGDDGGSGVIAVTCIRRIVAAPTAIVSVAWFVVN